MINHGSVGSRVVYHVVSLRIEVGIPAAHMTYDPDKLYRWMVVEIISKQSPYKPGELL